MNDELDAPRRTMAEVADAFQALQESIGPGGPSVREILADSRRELELRAFRPSPCLLSDDDRDFLARQDELAERYRAEHAND